MKNIMIDIAQVTCGLSKGPCSHKETWCWGKRRKSMDIGKM